MWTDAFVILALIAVNGVFSGAEIATLSVRRTRLRELVEAGRKGARSLEALRDQPERFLATVQIGITVVSAAAAAFGGDVFAEKLAWAIAKVPALAPYAKKLGFAAVVGLIAYLSVVFGELVPKSLALRSAEAYALVIGKPLLLLAYIARPFVWLLTASSNVVLRLFGDRTSFTEARLSPDEIQELVEEAAKSGTLDERTSEIASRAIEFRNLTAASVMVPRVGITALSKDATIEQVRKVLSSKPHSRIPVYEGPVDNIIGYVATKDMLEPALRGDPPELAKLLRPVHFVPAALKAVDLLQQMQTRRGSIAIVVDEQGGLLGLVTMEDLVEELVGDILSEHDTAHETIKKEAGGTALVFGTAPVREINWQLGLDLPEGDTFFSIAGLCLSLAESIPQAGTRLVAQDGTELEIVESSPRRVRLVRIHPKRQDPPTSPLPEEPKGE